MPNNAGSLFAQNLDEFFHGESAYKTPMLDMAAREATPATNVVGVELGEVPAEEEEEEETVAPAEETKKIE